MGNLSTNFNRREFACKGTNCCGGSAAVHPELIKGLQELRDILGKAIHITSGFRCVTHNRKVGGAVSSQHLYGMAADISVAEMTSEDLAKTAESISVFADGGIGIYKNFVHVDVRGKKTRWLG